MEQVLYGVALGVAGFVLSVHLVYKFVSDVARGEQTVAQSLLEGVDELLLVFVFVFAEVLHTVRVVLAMDVLGTEPFLMVGIVAAIRRFIVASAEASEESGRPKFDDLVMELGVLIAAVLVLGFTIWLLRHSRPEPIEMDEQAEETGGPSSEEVSEGARA